MKKSPARFSSVVIGLIVIFVHLSLGSVSQALAQKKDTVLPSVATNQYLGEQGDSENPSTLVSPIPLPLVIVPGTVVVESTLEQAVSQALGQSQAALSAASYFAITDEQMQGRWKIISVIGLVGLDETLEWNLERNGNWFGLVIAERLSTRSWEAAVEGTASFSEILSRVPDTVLSARAKLDIDPLARASRSATDTYVFPWEAGKSMQYGQLGVHNNDFNGIVPGWKAVDFLSDGNTGAGHAPNSLRASAAGTISYKCSPSSGQVTTAIRINDLMYAHLNNSGSLYVGRSYNQGDELGSLKTGDFSENCGWADQGSNQFHVHWGFPNTGSLQVSGWTLSFADGQWRKGSETKGVLSWIMAENGGQCPAPSLVSPDDNATFTSRTISFSWNSISGCSFQGYRFRVCSFSPVSNLFNCFINDSVSGTSRTVTIDNHDNMNLYWGVSADNAPNGANWAERRFRIEPGGGGDCNPGNNEVAVYRDHNHSGQCAKLGAGNYTRWEDMGLTENDKMSSIKVGGNVFVFLCVDNDYNGDCEWYDSNVSDLPDKLDDKVSSMRVVNKEYGCQPGSNEIALFADGNYGGLCVKLGQADYSKPAWIGLKNDSASSIRVGGNVQAVLYENDGYGGREDIHRGDDGNLGDNPIGNDSVSSVKVQTRPQPPTANFDAWPPSGTAPFMVTFHDTSQGNYSTCQWNYGDGNSRNQCDSDRYHDYTYTVPGTYSVSLTVTGAGGSNTKTIPNYITVLPPIPVTPSISAISNPENDGAYTVSWSSSNGATSYELQEKLNNGGWSTVQTSSATSKAYSNKGVGAWCYQVRASNTAGNSSYSSPPVCTNVNPAAPVLNAITNPESDGSYSVTWPTVSGATSYVLQELFPNGVWSQIYAGSNLFYNVSGRGIGQWCYRAYSLAANLSSGWSNQVCTTVTLVSPTINPISPPTAEGNFTVTWSSVSGATGYLLQEQYDDNGSWQDVHNGQATQKQFTNKIVGKWCYRVRSYINQSNSAWSATVCTEIKPAIPSIENPINPESDGNYTVTWGSVPYATAYELQESRWGNTIEFQTIATTQSTSYQITAQRPGAWLYQVRALHGSISGDWTDSFASLALVEFSTPILYPIDNSDGDGEYTLSWSESEEATKYAVLESINDGSYDDIVSVETLSHTVRGRSTGKYCYTVQAHDGLVASDRSNEECVLVGDVEIYDIANDDGDGNFIVSWSPLGGTIDYELRERFNFGRWETILTTGETEVELTDKASGEWCYQVRPGFGGGSSDWSGVKCTTVDAPPPCDPGPDGIVLYEHSYYMGRCITLTGDDTNLSDNGFNDIVSSLEFAGDYADSYWQITLFGGENFSGPMVNFRADDPDLNNNPPLGNDATSSIRMWYDMDDGYTMALNETIGGTIDVPSDGDMYQFYGRAGQVITIEMEAWYSTVDSYLELYGPNWGRLAVDDDSGGSSNARIQSIKLWKTGFYRIYARSYAYASSGGYQLKLIADCNPAANGVVLYEGVNYSGRCITLAADDPNLADDGFNDVVSSVAFMGSYAGGAYQITLATDANYGGWGTNLRFSDANLSNNAVGQDRASSVRIWWDSDDGRTIGLGEYLDGNIYVSSDGDMHLFNGTAGQTITIDMTRWSGNLNPYLVLYDPNWNIVAEDDNSAGNLNARIQSYTLNASGLYRIQAKSYRFFTTGDYTLSVMDY